MTFSVPRSFPLVRLDTSPLDFCMHKPTPSHNKSANVCFAETLEPIELTYLHRFLELTCTYTPVSASVHRKGVNICFVFSYLALHGHHCRPVCQYCLLEPNLKISVTVNSCVTCSPQTVQIMVFNYIFRYNLHETRIIHRGFTK